MRGSTMSNILALLLVAFGVWAACSLAYVEVRDVFRKTSKELEAEEEMARALLYDYAQYVPEVLQVLPPARRPDTFQRPPDGLNVGDLTNEEIGWLAMVGMLPWAKEQQGKRLEQAQKLLEEAELEKKRIRAAELEVEAEKRRLEAERRSRRESYDRKVEREKARAEREKAKERDGARRIWQKSVTDAAGIVHYEMIPPDIREELGFECAPCHSLDEDVTGTRFWRDVDERTQERNAKIDDYIDRVKAIMPDVEVKIEKKLTQREQDDRRKLTERVTAEIDDRVAKWVREDADLREHVRIEDEQLGRSGVQRKTYSPHLTYYRYGHLVPYDLAEQVDIIRGAAQKAGRLLQEDLEIAKWVRGEVDRRDREEAQAEAREAVLHRLLDSYAEAGVPIPPDVMKGYDETMRRWRDRETSTRPDPMDLHGQAEFRDRAARRARKMTQPARIHYD